MNTLSGTSNKIQEISQEASEISRECLIALNSKNNKRVQDAQDEIRYKFNRVFGKIIELEEIAAIPEIEALKSLKRDLDAGHFNVEAIYENLDKFSKEINIIRDNIQTSVRDTLGHTGIKLHDAQVTQLDGDCAGRFITDTKVVKIDPKMLTKDTLGHVLTHEAIHQQNFESSIPRGKGQVREDLDEALTEMRTAKARGENIMVYHDKMPEIANAARAARHIDNDSSISHETLLDLHAKGENDRLNQYYNAAHGKPDSPSEEQMAA
ncbi:hypothetical protein ACFL21_00950 [Patescibacteria group bacterium]